MIWAGGDPQRDPPYHAHPRRGPITDYIGTVGVFLLRYAGLSQTEWLGVNLSDLIYIKKGSKVESLHLLI